MVLMQPDDPERRAPTNRFALWALGFRPLYLSAALFAVLALGLWLLVWGGKVALTVPGVWWHAHEMVFGFVAAVIVGFLFTAGRNWTGLPTPSGFALAALVLLWLAGRVAMLLGGWGALLDLLFLPLAAAALARVLWRARSHKQYFVVLLLALLSLANLVFHLARLGLMQLDPLLPLHVALAIVILLETVISGRVVPSFTASAIKGIQQWRPSWLDVAVVVASAAALLCWALLPGQYWVGALLLLAASLQLARLVGWNPWAARHVPMLWILHLSCSWIPAGMILLAAALWGGLPQSAGIHALTIGATGGLILGMMTRTALGHTGRAPLAGRIETAAFVLIQFAAVVRVSGIVWFPAAATLSIHLAASAWMLAFALFLWRYTPFLLRARADGLPG